MMTPASEVQPPTTSHAAPASGAGAVRPTVAVRPHLAVSIRPIRGVGYSPDDPEIRRFWVAVLGAGAVADLLRLISCASRRVTIRRPVYLHVLITSELATVGPAGITVVDRFPPLPVHLARRLPPGLRAEYREFDERRRSDQAA